MAEVELKDLVDDPAPASTDILMKQAAAGGAGSTKGSSMAATVASSPPKAHTASHTDGSDDIQDATAGQKGVATAAQITKLDGITALADVTGANAPQVHAASHQDGGGDEISVAGLSGELADDQRPKTHASDHTDGADDIQDATAGQKGVATAAQITKLDGITALADVTGANAPQAHAASHTDGGDDIQDATAGQKGLATAAQITKLDGVEALAEVNDVDSVHGRTGAVVAVSGDYDHSELGSIGFDDHKTVTTTSTTDGAAKTIETIAVADDTVVEIIAEIVGRRTDAADRIGGRIRATVYREAAGGVVVEGVSKDFAASDAQYDLNVVGSGNDALVQVTGRAGHTLNWRSVSAVNLVS